MTLSKLADLKVVPGQVVVDCVELLVDTPDVLIMEVRCGTPPGTCITWQRGTPGDQQAGLDVWAAPHAFRGAIVCEPPRTADPTTIMLPGHVLNWTVITSDDTKFDHATLRVIAYRPGGERIRAWP